MSALDFLHEAPAWHAQAACRGLPSDLFFPADEGLAHGPGPPAYDAARLVCGACPVREPCAEAGKSEPYGCWGGTTPAERRRNRRKGRAA